MKSKIIILLALIIFNRCRYKKFLRDPEWESRMSPHELIYGSDRIDFEVLFSQNQEVLEMDTLMLHYEGKPEKKDSSKCTKHWIFYDSMQFEILDTCISIGSNKTSGAVWTTEKNTVFDVYIPKSKQFSRFKVIKKYPPIKREDDYYIKLVNITKQNSKQVKLIKYSE
ncbi:MAG: hypothetical protein MRY83_06405 [Flavobacteriales bacterium]|nr:hypothetical protein [Flavobacteriales bacterium]